MSADYTPKSIADNQFEAGSFDAPEAELPSCEGCDCTDQPLKDYFNGMLGPKTRLMLCEDCEVRQAERASLRSDDAYYGSSTPQTAHEHTDARSRGL